MKPLLSPETQVRDGTTPGAGRRTSQFAFSLSLAPGLFTQPVPCRSARGEPAHPSDSCYLLSHAKPRDSQPGQSQEHPLCLRSSIPRLTLGHHRGRVFTQALAGSTPALPVVRTKALPDTNERDDMKTFSLETADHVQAEGDLHFCCPTATQT